MLTQHFLLLLLLLLLLLRRRHNRGRRCWWLRLFWAQEVLLKKLAPVMDGGAESLLKDNSWPRMTDHGEIAAVCTHNPILMQCPVVRCEPAL
eukprot:SAG11_NODE_1509_length_4774_cov_5.905668_5_plen_92_part_00